MNSSRCRVGHNGTDPHKAEGYGIPADVYCIGEVAAGLGDGRGQLDVDYGTWRREDGEERGQACL